MGRKDIVTKEYIRRSEIFADIFNYRLYDGIDRIHPEQLAEENIAENLILEREGHGKEELLSGFYREDWILPVITLVLYFGTAPWDGPRSLKEMMRWTGEEAEKYIQDYRLNLIIPAEMEDEEIEKLQSSLREVFYFLKYAGDWKKLEKILTDDERFQRLETEAATVIRELTNTEIEIKKEQEEQNMCKAIEQMKEKERKIGLEDGKRIGLEDGKRIGLENGKRIGRELGEAEIILRMYQKGYGSGQIAEMTDMEEERVKAIICMKLEIK